MKKLVSILSALTLFTVMPMSASAVDYVIEGNAMILSEDFWEKASADLSIYDFNADGVTNRDDAILAMEVYANTAVGNIKFDRVEIKATYIADCVLEEFSEEEINRAFEYGNITNPEWESGTMFNGKDDNMDSLDASFLLCMIYDQYDDGDVNTDGAVDALDASNVLAFYSKGQSGVADAEYDKSGEKEGVEYLGDYNADGAIDALDASNILSDYSEAQTA